MILDAVQDYEGEREFDDLDKFAKENLGPRWCRGLGEQVLLR